jgi:hypothetical protein
MAPILQAAAADLDIAFLLHTTCPAIFGGDLVIPHASYPHYDQYCRDVRSEAVKKLRDDSSISLVILASSWVYLPRQIAGTQNVDDPSGLARMKTEFEALIKETSRPGRRFIIIGSVPQLDKKTVACGNDLGFLHRPCSDGLLSPQRSTVFTRATDDLIADIEREFPSVIALSPTDALCGAERCSLSVNDQFLYRDTSHIRRNLKPDTRRILADRIGLTGELKQAAASVRR